MVKTNEMYLQTMGAEDRYLPYVIVPGHFSSTTIGRSFASYLHRLCHYKDAGDSKKKFPASIYAKKIT